MSKLWFSLSQGVKSLANSRSKFYLVTLEIAVAIALCNILCTVAYSVKIAEKQFREIYSDSMVKVYPTQHNRDAKKVPYQLADLEEFEKFIAGKGRILLFFDRPVHAKPESVGEGNRTLSIRFTNTLSTGTYFATPLAEQFLSEATFWGFDGAEAYYQLKNLFTIGSLKKVTLDKSSLNQYYLESPRNKVEKECLLLLPLTLYFDLGHVVRTDQYLLTLVFDHGYDAQCMTRVAKLLDDFHGNDFSFHYISTYKEFQRNVSQIGILAKGLILMVGGGIIVIVLGLGGIVASIIKKRMIDISVRFCLGVSSRAIYFEILLILLIPSIIGSVLGLCCSFLLLNNLDFTTFTLTINFWISAGSLVLACLIGMVAGILPLIKLKQIQPLQVLKEEL